MFKNSPEKRRKKQKKITESTENTIVKKKKEDYGIIKSETKSPQSNVTDIKMYQTQTKKCQG